MPPGGAVADSRHHGLGSRAVYINVCVHGMCALDKISAKNCSIAVWVFFFHI